jgi:hypothetical protein
MNASCEEKCVKLRSLNVEFTKRLKAAREEGKEYGDLLADAMEVLEAQSAEKEVMIRQNYEQQGANAELKATITHQQIVNEEERYERDMNISKQMGVISKQIEEMKVVNAKQIEEMKVVNARQIKEMKVLNAKQEIVNATQSAQIEELNVVNAAQSAQIEVQSAQIAELKVVNAAQSAQIAELKVVNVNLVVITDKLTASLAHFEMLIGVVE